MIEIMDRVSDAIEEGFSFFCNYFIKPLAIILLEIAVVISYPAWIIPYKIFRKNRKNKIRQRLTPRKEMKNVKTSTALRRRIKG